MIYPINIEASRGAGAQAFDCKQVVGSIPTRKN